MPRTSLLSVQHWNWCCSPLQASARPTIQRHKLRRLLSAMRRHAALGLLSVLLGSLLLASAADQPCSGAGGELLFSATLC